MDLLSHWLLISMISKPVRFVQFLSSQHIKKCRTFFFLLPSVRSSCVVELCLAIHIVIRLQQLLEMLLGAHIQ